ncbi:MAG: type II toxin-antitoxin system HicB family antitoxin [Chloroflexi bacterium]|nr:type II toxin-antitoxin system HicB family antitoxin [Chloroflexota bacterium]
MKYTVLIEKGPTNFGAYVPDLPGCIAVADTREEVIALIQEGIVYYLEEMHNTGQSISEPSTTALVMEVESPAAVSASA